MKKIFLTGMYAIKIKGRGIIRRYLTSTEARVLFRRFKDLEMESIELDDETIKGDMTFIYTNGEQFNS